MDGRRAQDILKHIFQDKDKGVAMMQSLPLDEAIQVMAKILPECQKKAEEKDSVNDIGFFADLTKVYETIVIDKIKNAERLWVAYSDNTGYPYIVDSDLIVLYTYANHGEVENKINEKGYNVTFGIETAEDFKQEIGHMYRNGYKNVRFIDGKSEAYTVSREQLYAYDEYFDDKYVSNPALQSTMLDYFQELRKDDAHKTREDILVRCENAIILALKATEFMIPCQKEEDEEEVTISYPFVDLTGKLSDHDESEKIIAVPVFTDGFELNKCFEGHHETMLYKYDELIDMVKELDASGIVINPLGISFFLSLDMMKEMRGRV